MKLPPSREEVERDLGTTLSCSPKPGALVCEYVDRDAVPYQMAFENAPAGRLMGLEVGQWFFPPPAEYPLYSEALVSIWWWLLEYDLWLMLALFGLCLIDRRRRVLWAEVMAMAAIGRTITRWPRLGACTLQEYLHADFLPWATVVLSASACVLIWAYYHRPERSLVRCPACDYNLVGGEARICPECGTPVGPEVHENIMRVESLRQKTPIPAPSL